jgi:hypothetical protein
MLEGRKELASKKKFMPLRNPLKKNAPAQHTYAFLTRMTYQF